MYSTLLHSSSNILKICFLTWLSQAHISMQSPIQICVGKATFEYEMNSCPGGIQLRDMNRWLSKTREKVCISGSGPVLQFDGEDPTPPPDIYPSLYPFNLRPFQGSFHAYKLESNYEQLLGKQTSALLVDIKYFEDPDNFPHRPLEILVNPTEHKRLAGSYKLGISNGRYSKEEVQLDEMLRTVMFNTKDPILIASADPKKNKKRLCAHTTKPQIILAKYYTSTWFQPGEITTPNCGSKSHPPFDRPRGVCRSMCTNSSASTDDTKSEEKPAQQFQQIFKLMAEVSLRMKYSKKEIDFGDAQPHISLLLKSCKVFFRAFPNVVKWETLEHAVTIFGITFEGLIPAQIEAEAFNHIKIALGRCALAQSRQREDNNELFNKICGNRTAGSDSNSNEFNSLIELLWKIVQFTQAKCLPSADHYPNVHHFYAAAMIELFSSPTVQLLWHQGVQKGKEEMSKAMLHVLPELPDHALGTIQAILKDMDYQIYFAILRRPKIKNLETRDMRCAGHGKVIWGGRACCYLEEEDKKYYFYNRVSFAKL